MPAQAVFALAAVLAVAVCLAPLRQSFALLLVTTLLVPTSLVLPNGFSAYLTVDAVVWVAAGAGLALRVRRGEVARGSLRPTPLHLALLAFVLVALYVGIALASAGTDPVAQAQEWARIVEQLLFFVIALAYARAIARPSTVLAIVAGSVVAYAALGIGERLSGFSWGHFLFSHVHSAPGTSAALALEQRGGQARVRSGAEFALEFAWVCAMLLPAVLVRMARATGARRLAWTGGVVVVLVAVMLSVTRSAFLGVAVGAVVAWVGLRFDRRIGAALLVAAAASLAVVTMHPSVLGPYRSSSATGSSNVRVARLPAFMQEAAQRPFIGQGLASAQLGPLGPTDSSYLDVYVELGAVGLTVFSVLLAASLLSAGRGLRGPPGGDADVSAASVAGMCVALVGAAALDLFSLLGSAQPFWLLAGLALAAGERVRGPMGLPHLAPWRVALPLAAVGAGAAVAVLWPARGVEVVRFTAFPASFEAAAQQPTTYEERRVLQTACDIGSAAQIRSPVAASVGCRLVDAGDSGVGELRVTAADPAAAARATTFTEIAMGELGTIRLFPLGPATSYRPTAVKVAPVVAGLLGLGIAGLVPGRRRRQVTASSGVASPLSRVKAARA